MSCASAFTSSGTKESMQSDTQAEALRFIHSDNVRRRMDDVCSLRSASTRHQDEEKRRKGRLHMKKKFTIEEADMRMKAARTVLTKTKTAPPSFETSASTSNREEEEDWVDVKRCTRKTKDKSFSTITFITTSQLHYNLTAEHRTHEFHCAHHAPPQLNSNFALSLNVAIYGIYLFLLLHRVRLRAAEEHSKARRQEKKKSLPALGTRKRGNAADIRLRGRLSDEEDKSVRRTWICVPQDEETESPQPKLMAEFINPEFFFSLLQTRCCFS